MSYSYETGKDSNNFTPANLAQQYFGMARVIEGITLHWWGDPNQGPQFDSIVSYLCNNSSNTSAHFVATGTNRRVACIVAPHDIAHHSGSAWGNARTIGIELDPRNRPEDRDVLAELIADIRSAYGDVPLYWHNYFISTACPGVYRQIVEELDQLSYTKFSHATNWGQGGDINPKAPTPAPVPPQTPTTTPSPVLYKLLVAGKQVAAYSTEANAYKGYVEYGKKGVIKHGDQDVTAALVAKYMEPSPTAGQPDSGKPVIEKDDYEELKKRVSILEAFVELLKIAWKKIFNRNIGE